MLLPSSIRSTRASLGCKRIGLLPSSFALAAILSLGTTGCELVLGDIPPDHVLDSGVGDDPEFDDDEPEIPEDVTPAPNSPAPNEEPEEPEEPEEETGDAAVTPPPVENCSGTGVWYADQDKDGYGAGAPHTSCEKPAGNFSERTGDCADNDPRVHPSQKAYFAAPYVRSNGTASFDYDCSGSEDGNASQSVTPDCSKLTLMCGGSGYMKANRPGAPNPYCGSTTIETCKASAVTVFPCKSETTATDVAYGCH